MKPRVVSTHFSRICFTSGYIARLRDCKPRDLGRQQTTVYNRLNKNVTNLCVDYTTLLSEIIASA